MKTLNDLEKELAESAGNILFDFHQEMQSDNPDIRDDVIEKTINKFTQLYSHQIKFLLESVVPEAYYVNPNCKRCGTCIECTKRESYNDCRNTLLKNITQVFTDSDNKKKE